MSKLIVITGPSGVGKGTLIARLREQMPELRLAVSATTRPPREGEQDGIDYHFMSATQFAEGVESDQFLEHAEYSGNHYGTLRSELDRGQDPVLLEIELQGARQVAERTDDALLVFIAPPDEAALEQRLRGRGTDADDAIAKRLETAKIELAARDEFSRVIVNDELERAVDELESVVRAAVA